MALLEPDKCYAQFQQDDMRLHVSKESIAMLQDFFNNCLISAELCHHSRLIYVSRIFFCGAILRTAPTSTLPLCDVPKGNIAAIINAIPRWILQHVTANTV